MYTEFKRVFFNFFNEFKRVFFNFFNMVLDADNIVLFM